jgi:hypothetical protein
MNEEKAAIQLLFGIGTKSMKSTLFESDIMKSLPVPYPLSQKQFQCTCAASLITQQGSSEGLGPIPIVSPIV